MCPPRPQEATTEPSAAHVVRWERVDAGARAALIRVTLTFAGTPPPDVSEAQLVTVDGEHTERCDALPVPPPVETASLAMVTLGFAVARTATPLGLVLGGRSFALAEPDDAGREAERRLRILQARLDASRGVCATMALEREEARRAAADAERARGEAVRAVARAEAAAHDASERAAAQALPREDAPSAPAAAGFAWRLGSRRAAAGACAIGSAALLAALLAWPARDGDSDRHASYVAARASAADSPPSAAPAVDPLAARLGIPADYLALYRRAGARYGLDWIRLAAVGAIESGHGQAGVTGIVAGANPRGASGPAQFLPGTWERFGVDGDGDGDRNPYDPADAIPAMASYLRASGAPQDWPGALRSYNHSDAYVSAVEALAASLRDDAS